ncbi:hypothetical protein WMY93_006967 [Mugilogobius chulae]|uniref:SGNH hydrolase-type esterase domain-containing protein n=1 Tax=Mugilogobius chulae TaxID=88201 RepID=A0AAW0PUW4_9GOBI
MPPTSPSCEICVSLIQKVLELEKRISKLHQIREDERDLDILLGKTLAEANSAQLADTDPLPGSPVQLHSDLPCIPISDDENWIRRGAKPKGSVFASSTPLHKEPWIVVRPQKTKRLSTSPTRDSKRAPEDRRSLPDYPSLQNRFSALDFPPLTSQSMPLQQPVNWPSSRAGLLPGGKKNNPPLVHRHPKESSAAATTVQPAPRQRVPQRTVASAPTAGNVKSRHSGRPGSFHKRQNPTVLVLGSSIVRHVRVQRGFTSCMPGAYVKDLHDSAPQIISQLPSVSTVVIHVGSNDLKRQQSEKLKDDFIALINSIQSTGKKCVISGPLPAPCFGDVKFSRLRQLHVWLKAFCAAKEIPFVDNFAAFFRRPELFRRDRLHLSFSGARLLSFNMNLTLETFTEKQPQFVCVTSKLRPKVGVRPRTLPVCRRSSLTAFMCPVHVSCRLFSDLPRPGAPLLVCVCGTARLR